MIKARSAVLMVLTLALGSGCSGDNNDRGTGGSSNTGTGGAGATTGTGGDTSTTGGGGPDLCTDLGKASTGESGLIDDVEDCDATAIMIDERNGGWWATGNMCTLTPLEEGSIGGEGRPVPEVPTGTNASNAAIHIRGTGCGPDFGMSVSLSLNTPSNVACQYDASNYDGVYFWAKAESDFTTKSVRFMIQTRQSAPIEQGGDGSCFNPATGAGCWDSFGKTITLTEEWALYSFAWTDLTQEGWGTPTTFSAADTQALVWAVTLNDVLASTAGDFWVDQVGFYTGTAPTDAPAAAAEECSMGGAGGM